MHNSNPTFLTNPRFVILCQRSAQPPLIFLSLNFSGRQQNQIELVIPSLWKKLPKTEILCYPAAKIWPPLSLSSLCSICKVSAGRICTGNDLPGFIIRPVQRNFSMIISLKVSFLWELWHLETATKCYVQIFDILSSSLTTQSFWKFFEAAKFEIVGICYILQ